MRHEEHPEQILPELRRKEAGRIKWLDLSGLRHKRYSEQVLPQLRCTETGRKTRVDLPGVRYKGYYDKLLPELRRPPSDSSRLDLYLRSSQHRKILSELRETPPVKEGAYVSRQL